MTTLVVTVGLFAASTILHRQVVPVALGPMRPVAFEEVVPNPGDVDYPPPEGAYFVAPDGNDANDGRTIDTPLRTLGQAIAVTRMAPGATIVLRGGTYREGLSPAAPAGPHRFSHRLTIQPYRQEKVWLKGSDVVTGWVQDGTAWRHDGWTARFCLTQPTGADRFCKNPELFNPAYPMAGAPDMVFIGGQPVRQVGSRAEVVPGTFFVDYATSALFLGDDPNGAEVEASARDVALHFVTGPADGTVIQGLGFAHYAANENPSNSRGGAVLANARGWVFENNTVAWTNSVGLYSVAGDSARPSLVGGNLFTRNGYMGARLTLSHGLVITGNRFTFNNQEGLHDPDGSASGASGTKVTRSDDVRVEDNIFENNDGTGFWCDLDCRSVTIVRNITRDNRRNGISFEVSNDAIIASNLAVGNGAWAGGSSALTAGIKLAGSQNVRVYNNTLYRNLEGIQVRADPREPTTGVALVNNLFSESARSTTPLGHLYDPSSTTADNALVATMDFNSYHRPTTSQPATLIDGSARYTTLAAFRAAAPGREGNGQEHTQTPNPHFVDAAAGNFAVRRGSPAFHSGAALPPDIALAVGVGAAPVDRGALSWPGTPPRVNEAPTAGDDAFSTDEDSASTVPAPGVLADDADPDGDGLTATVANSPAHGTLTLQADGGFRYTPDPDFHGPDSFTYRAGDGGASSGPATVTITVGPIDDAPTAGDDAFSTDEDTPLSVPVPGVLSDDADPEGDAVTATMASPPAHGTLDLQADGGLDYTPDPDFHGPDSFTYRAGDGRASSAPATVSITVRPVNDAPGRTPGPT